MSPVIVEHRGADDKSGPKLSQETYLPMYTSNNHSTHNPKRTSSGGIRAMFPTKLSRPKWNGLAASAVLVCLF